GGTAVILGGVGDNFAAGMTGGMAFVFDRFDDFHLRLNDESVVYQRLASSHWEGVLKALIEEHVAETGSTWAADMLHNWERDRARFWQVCPKEMVNRIAHPLNDAEAAPLSIPAE